MAKESAALLTEDIVVGNQLRILYMFMRYHIIAVERDAIVAEGLALEREKDTALDANAQLGDNYDIRLLRLIRRIIAHDRVSRNALTLNQRKSNLCNIVKSIQLLKHIPQKYNNIQEGYKNANLWSDFSYLSKFKISNPNPHIIQPCNINDREIIDLLEGQCITILDSLCEAEILAYDTPLQTARVTARDQNILQYRNHRNNQQLYIKVAYYREIEQLDKAIEAMLLAERVILGVGVAEPENTIHKITVLRAFVVLGEAATQKNLTPHTKALASGFIAGDWQLFIDIRNQLAHTEWDIHSRSLEDYLRTNDFTALQAELPYIKNQFGQVKLALVNLNNAHGLQAHYTTPAVVPTAAVYPLTAARALHGALPDQANDHHRMYPDSFTPDAMVQRIRAEVIALEAELAGCPLTTLDDIHNEDTHCLSGDHAAFFIDALHNVNTHRPYSTEENILFRNNLNAIIAYFINPDELQLELPQGLLPVQLSRTGQGSSANIELNDTALITHLHDRFDQYMDTIAQYRRSLDFINILKTRSTLCCACQHRIGRIGKFLSKIPSNTLDPLIGNMQRREIKALRDLVQHGDDMIDISSIPKEAFLLHYLRLIMRRLVPALVPPVIYAAPDPHAEESFLERNGKTVLKAAVATFVAGGLLFLYKTFIQKNANVVETNSILSDPTSEIAKIKPNL